MVIYLATGDRDDNLLINPKGATDPCSTGYTGDVTGVKGELLST